MKKEQMKKIKSKAEKILIATNQHPNYYLLNDVLYTFEGNSLLCKDFFDDDWGEVNVEHTACEGLNLYKVFNHFNKADLYAEILLNELEAWKTSYTELEINKTKE